MQFWISPFVSNSNIISNLLLIAFIFFSITHKNKKLIFDYFYFSFLLYMGLISLIFNEKNQIETYFYYLVFVFLFSIIFAIEKRSLNSNDVFVFIIIFLVNILFMFSEKTLIYREILYFNFESATYSKPLTLYFSISSIIFAFSLNNFKEIKYKVTFSLLLLFSIYLAIMAGGRAEFLSLFLILIYIFRSKFIYIQFFLPVLILFFYYNVELLESFNSLYRIFNSFDITNKSNLSMRDELLFIFVNNIDIDCIVFGCGINSFQELNNLNIGLYPHNLILELIYSVGIFGLILFTFIFYKSYKKIGQLEKNILVFITIVSFISGQLITNFLMFYLLNNNKKS
ncbi:O-antigen polymerase precursor [Aequoribacter fuscus]|uniref:O-antigen polymerase n=1 Tax=Aequoribacter fuscus TaxID=2518989 RepID=F3L3R1_9GAMM|nr:O-antigen polymerase precursor [Aequoribacter fuscus]